MIPRKTLNVKRFGTGTRDHGRYIDGVATAITIQASVQPTDGQKLALETKSERALAAYRLFSSAPLLLNDSVIQRQADEVEIYGDWYKVIQVMPWQNGLIPHYNIVVAREL